MKVYDVTITFTEGLLGTVSQDPETYRAFIQKRALEAGKELEEVEDEMETLGTVDEAVAKSSTGFHRLEDGTPAIYDYVIKGCFKGACGALRRVKADDGQEATLSSKLTAFKKIIDTLVFVKPRRIPLVVAGEEDSLERPLRAQTAQGERIALTRSEMVLPGSQLTFKVYVMGVVSEDLLREWLGYGEWLGMGQWRSGGWGTYTYTLTPA